MTQSKSWLTTPSASSLRLAQPVISACGHLTSSMLQSTRSAVYHFRANCSCPRIGCSALLTLHMHILFGFIPNATDLTLQVTSKVVSLAWTNDGQFLALGLYDGHISIRTRVGEETTTIQRDAPVWTLSWNPSGYIVFQTKV